MSFCIIFRKLENVAAMILILVSLLCTFIPAMLVYLGDALMSISLPELLAENIKYESFLDPINKTSSTFDTQYLPTRTFSVPNSLVSLTIPTFSSRCSYQNTGTFYDRMIDEQTLPNFHSILTRRNTKRIEIE